MHALTADTSAHAAAFSCDTAVALGDTTVDGSVLLAKNSDRGSHEAQRLISVPGAEHSAGATVHCTYLTIPQVRRTAALIGSQPYWLWGFEHGMNEFGVAIGNEAIHTRDGYAETGLLGMDLLRLGLERGTTARGALDAITFLLETYGQGGSADHHESRYYQNSFIIADPKEAWVLETSGRRWVAKRLTSGTSSISNVPTVTTTYDTSSPDLIEHAEECGWWERGRRPFDFARAYTNVENPGLPSATCRLAGTRRRLQAGGQGGLTPIAMMALLRDHGPGPNGEAAALSWPTGYEVNTVCMHGADTMGATAASVVAHLTPGQRPTSWGSMAPPCTGIFLPCWVDSGPASALATAGEEPSATSPWWRFRHLWEATASRQSPGAEVEGIRRSWAPVEAEIRGWLRDLAPDASVAARRALTERTWMLAEQALVKIEATSGKVPVA